eukprot:3616251-Pleurochrysis_carterae.AAC.4
MEWSCACTDVVSLRNLQMLSHDRPFEDMDVASHKKYVRAPISLLILGENTFRTTCNASVWSRKITLARNFGLQFTRLGVENFVSRLVLFLFTPFMCLPYRLPMCWDEDPAKRPSFAQIVRQVSFERACACVASGRGDAVVRLSVPRLEHYSAPLGLKTLPPSKTAAALAPASTKKLPSTSAPGKESVRTAAH